MPQIARGPRTVKRFIEAGEPAHNRNDQGRPQLQEEWETVEAAIYVVLDTTGDQSGPTVGRAALDAARQIRARWIPDADDLP